jgi:hypothetical protein
MQKGFDAAGFVWAVERDLAATATSNAAAAVKKIEEATKRREQEKLEEEEEERRIQEERAAAVAAVAAAANASADAGYSQYSGAGATFESRPTMAPSLSLQLQLGAAASADAAGSPQLQSHIADLEALYERQHAELSNVRGQLRGLVRIRTEFEGFRREYAEKEARWNENIEMLQMKLANQRQKNKQISSNLEGKVNQLTSELGTSVERTAILQTELDRSMSESTRLREDLAAANRKIEEMELKGGGDTGGSGLVSRKQLERLEKRLQESEAAAAEFVELQRAHALALDEIQEVSVAYEQLHAAYSSETELFAEAQKQIAALQAELAQAKLRNSAHASTRNNMAENLLLSGTAPEATESLISATAAAGDGETDASSSPKGESLRDELLDAFEPPVVAAPGTAAEPEPLPEPLPDDEEAELPPAPNTNEAAQVEAPADKDAKQTGSEATEGRKGLPRAASQPLSAQGRKSFSSSSSQADGSSPLPGQQHQGLQHPLAQPRRSFSSLLARHAIAFPGLAMPQQLRATFVPHKDNARSLNFQFFQLVLNAVASKLSISPDFAGAVTKVATENHLQALYTEAMTEQVAAQRYSLWIEQKLRKQAEEIAVTRSG